MKIPTGWLAIRFISLLGLFLFMSDSFADGSSLQAARKQYFDFLFTNPKADAATTRAKTEEFREFRRKELNAGMRQIFRAGIEGLPKEGTQKKTAEKKSSPPLTPNPTDSVKNPNSGNRPKNGNQAANKNEKVVLDPSKQPSVLDFSGATAPSTAPSSGDRAVDD